MSKPQLQPSTEYRLSELAEMIGKTRTTIDRYIERFSIKTTSVIHLGKKVQAAVLTEENIKQILSLQPEIEESHNSHLNPGYNNASQMFKQHDNLLEQVDTLREKLHKAELEKTSFKERLTGLENELRRADDQIEILKQTNISLQNTLQASLFLENSKQPTLNFIHDRALQTGEIASKPGFFGKIKALQKICFKK